MSDDFLKSFAAVPRDQQQAVLTFVAKFRQNPTASGINYERIRDAGDPNMRSVRVNDNVRGIVLKPDVGNVYCLLWVDRHDDAYQWARRHRVAIHPDVGSIQIYAVEAASTPEAAASFADVRLLSDGFANRDPTLLMRWRDTDIPVDFYAAAWGKPIGVEPPAPTSASSVAAGPAKPAGAAKTARTPRTQSAASALKAAQTREKTAQAAREKLLESLKSGDMRLDGIKQHSLASLDELMKEIESNKAK